MIQHNFPLNTPNISKIDNGNCPISFYQDESFHKKHAIFNKYPFDPSQFRNQFDDALERADYKKIKRLRILIQRQIIDMCHEGTYLYNYRNHHHHRHHHESNLNSTVPLKKELMIQSSCGTVLIKKQLSLDKIVNDNNTDSDGGSGSSDGSSEKVNKRPRVRVINGDCVDVAFQIQDELIKEGTFSIQKVAILNMGNPNTAGGGYQSGCGAQEENLFRRSNLYQCLDNKIDQLDKNRQWSYPIGHETALYSPNVLFFRGCEAKGYPLLKTPRLLNVITAAAVPNKSKSSTKPKIDPRNLGTIEAIFKAAKLNGVRNLVLSAFGCGAYKNNPTLMANAFKQVLEEPLNCYQGCFDRIYFAIIEDHHSKKGHNPDGNIQPFLTVFKDYTKNQETEEDENLESQFVYNYENVDDYYEQFYNSL